MPDTWVIGLRDRTGDTAMTKVMLALISAGTVALVLLAWAAK
jgi:hypothetical protein